MKKTSKCLLFFVSAAISGIMLCSEEMLERAEKELADHKIGDFFDLVDKRFCLGELEKGHCKVLKEKGADINQPREDGVAPIHLCSLICPEKISLLRSFGANINAQIAGGETDSESLFQPDFTPLMVIIANGEKDYKVVKVGDSGKWGKREVVYFPKVKSLLSHPGVDVTLKAENGKTALDMAEGLLKRLESKREKMREIPEYYKDLTKQIEALQEIIKLIKEKAVAQSEAQ